MARGIKLSIKSSPYIYGRYDGVRVRIDVTESCGMPTHVFAYRGVQSGADAAVEEGVFSHICSTSDISEFPENDPTPGQQPRWFRLPFVDLLLRSWAEALDLIDCIKSDLRMLKRSLDNMETAVDEGVEIIGDICDESSSSPSSSSASVSSSSSSDSSSSSSV